MRLYASTGGIYRRTGNRQKFDTSAKPPWLSWLERQSHNLEVVSSILTGGIPNILFFLFFFLI